MDDFKTWIQIDTYNSVRIDEYKGKYSIQQGQRGEQVTYARWCCPQKWTNGDKTIMKKNGEPVFVPWSISLGTDKEQAIKTLQALCYALEKL